MSPLVSLGIPVYNGSPLIERAIVSLLKQDFCDFELIVVDNASTDGTRDLVTELARQDPRIRYYRNSENIGAARNFNRCFELSRGTYFKWSAHDDAHEPSFLRRCLERLETRPDAVLSFTEMAVEDRDGRVFRYQSDPLEGADSSNVVRRFHEILWGITDPTAPIFGLIRTSVLRRTGLIRNTPEPDRVLLGELSLYGAFLCIPEPLFLHRGPPGHESHYASEDVRQSRRSWEWLDPKNSRRFKLATPRIVKHHFGALVIADMDWTSKLVCAADLCIAAVTLRTRSKVRRLRQRWASGPAHLGMVNPR
ncbi:MAG: glycosyltransferase family 2 protein [Gemmatimonadota bacterium]